MNFLLGGGSDIVIELEGQDTRRKIDVKVDKTQRVRKLVYTDGEGLKGKVHINLKDKKLDHSGLKIEFLGQIEMYYDRGNPHEFCSLVQDLQPAGTLTKTTSFDFQFENVDFPHESYHGMNVKLRYFLRVTLGRRLSNTVQEQEIWVHKYSEQPEINSSIKLEVGIEGGLHIEFEYDKSKYSLKDVIVGKIYFLLVRVKIHRMELSIIKRETAGSGVNANNESETITKYEIMDGSPVRGECIPVRLFLNGFEMTPTYRDVNNKFSVRYYLNMVLIDETDRRYFKQQEITLWRPQSTAGSQASLAASENPLLS